MEYAHHLYLYIFRDVISSNRLFIDLYGLAIMEYDVNFRYNSEKPQSMKTSLHHSHISSNSFLIILIILFFYIYNLKPHPLSLHSYH